MITKQRVSSDVSCTTTGPTSNSQPAGGTFPDLLMLMPLLSAEMLETQAMTMRHCCTAWSTPLCLVSRLYVPA